MVEPKTQSILETIKKKLVKFESKNTENKVDKLSSEFSEVVPVNKDALLKNSNDNFNQSNQESGHNNKSESNKTEIDIDNESTVNKNFAESISKNENKIIVNYVEDFSEEDLEDYEDEADLKEEYDADLVVDKKEQGEENLDHFLDDTEEDSSLNIDQEDNIEFSDNDMEEELTTEEIEELSDLSEEELRDLLNSLEEESEEEIELEENLNVETKTESNHNLSINSIVQEKEIEKNNLESNRKTDIQNEHNKNLEIDEKNIDDKNLININVSIKNNLNQENKMQEQKKQETKNNEEKDPFDQELEELEKELQSRSESLSQPSQSDILAKKEADLKNLDQNKKESVVKNTKDKDDFDFENDLLEMEINKSKVENNLDSSKNSEKTETKNPTFENNQVNQSQIIENLKDQTIQESNKQLVQDHNSSPENVSLSKEVTSKVSQSIQKLMETKNSVVDSSPVYSQYIQSSAFNELAIKLIEPKIERWLENNLPQIVEKLVQNEIKKMI